MTGVLSTKYRTAFVTGASAGLGAAFTEMLLAEGVRVWGTSREVGRLADLVARPGFTAVALDLAQPSEALAAFRHAAGEAGASPGADPDGRPGFDLVVNNAGYGVFAAFEAAPVETWQAQLQAMLGGTLALSHTAYGQMRTRDRGCLVQVSSLATEFPLPYMSGYNIAKAGLSALSESLIFETRGSGVTVIDFRPGDYRTGFNHSMHTLRSPASGPFSPQGSPAPLAATSVPARLARAWATLEANLAAAPNPTDAAAELRRALLRGRSGVVRAGSFFQARLAPLFAKIAPDVLRRAIAARYFGAA